MWFLNLIIMVFVVLRWIHFNGNVVLILKSPNKKTLHLRRLGTIKMADQLGALRKLEEALEHAGAVRSLEVGEV